MAQPRLTVLFASRNGERWLPLVLEAMTKLQTPEEDFEIIAVDNGSTDATADILKSFSDRLPLTILLQPQPGKNRAMNTGLAHVRGDYLVMIDDDILVSENWLVKWYAAAAAFPATGIFGGRIEPYWMKPPEDWLRDAISLPMVYGLSGKRHVDGPIHPSLIFGGNMMVRMSLLAGGRRFDENIGPNGTANYAMGSETSFTSALAEEKGVECRHVSDIVVQHIIRPEQVSPKWVLKRYFRAGRGAARSQHSNFQGPHIAGVPRYLYRSVLRDIGHWLWALVRLKRIESFKARTALAEHRGTFYELRRQRKLS